jgi:predicted PurR-regulated permease PerM
MAPLCCFANSLIRRHFMAKIPNEQEEYSRPWQDRHLWQITPVHDAGWIALIVASLVFAYYLKGVFLPLLIAFLVAYLIDPMVSGAETRWRIPRLASLSFLSAIVLLGAAVAGLWLVPIIRDQVSSFLDNLPAYLRQISNRYGIDVGDITEQVQNLLKRMQEEPDTIIRALGQILGTTTQIVLWVMLVPLFSFYFSWRYPQITDWGRELLPIQRKGRILDILNKMDVEIGGFFRGRLLIAVICGGLFSVGWMLTGVPYWFLIGMLTGLISFIPYISVIGWLFAMAIKYLDMSLGDGMGFDWIAVLLWPSIVYTIVNIIEEGVLTPLIQSRTTALKPMTVLVVVLIGGKLAGFFGLLLAIPVAVCLRILATEVLLPHLRWRKEREFVER